MTELRRVVNMQAATPGTWWGARGGGHFAGLMWVSLLCPQCGHGMSIHRGGEGHRIAADGGVSPSVVCPYVGCGWHVFVRLLGWGESDHMAGGGTPT